MFFLPGILIAILTFPGVIVHEAAHQLFCRLTRTPVFEVCYFRFGNPVGYVVHEKVERPWKIFLICMGPFLVNTVLGGIIVFSSAIDVIEFQNYTNPISLFLVWLGASILMHSFPSTGDAKNLFEAVVLNKAVALWKKVVVMPFVGLIYAGAFGSIFWLDALYALAVGMLLPNLLVQLL